MVDLEKQSMFLRPRGGRRQGGGHRGHASPLTKVGGGGAKI